MFWSKCFGQDPGLKKWHWGATSPSLLFILLCTGDSRQDYSILGLVFLMWKKNAGGGWLHTLICWSLKLAPNYKDILKILKLMCLLVRLESANATLFLWFSLAGTSKSGASVTTTLQKSMQRRAQTPPSAGEKGLVNIRTFLGFVGGVKLLV